MEPHPAFTHKAKEIKTNVYQQEETVVVQCTAKRVDIGTPMSTTDINWSSISLRVVVSVL